jgi:hypothetical protein
MYARLVPSTEALHVARKELAAVARKYRGEYDGWESPVEKRGH